MKHAYEDDIESTQILLELPIEIWS